MIITLCQWSSKTSKPIASVNLQSFLISYRYNILPSIPYVIHPYRLLSAPHRRLRTLLHRSSNDDALCWIRDYLKSSDSELCWFPMVLPFPFGRFMFPIFTQKLDRSLKFRQEAEHSSGTCKLGTFTLFFALLETWLRSTVRTAFRELVINK